MSPSDRQRNDEHATMSALTTTRWCRCGGRCTALSDAVRLYRALDAQLADIESDVLWLGA